MSRDRAPSGRRAPRQRRSKETAKAIVEAAGRVFAEMGLEAATTGRIAEIAGVSVGSLYQYYPSKHALLTALFERESLRLQAVLLRIVVTLGVDDVPAIIRAYAEETLDVFESNAPLYRMLLDEVPRFAGLAPTHQVDLGASAALRGILMMVRDRISPRDLEIASAILVRTFRYNTLSILQTPLAGPQREAFLDEMTALMCNYLFGPRPPLRERS